jgi:hypothetical protein
MNELELILGRSCGQSCQAARLKGDAKKTSEHKMSKHQGKQELPRKEDASDIASFSCQAHQSTVGLRLRRREPHKHRHVCPKKSLSPGSRHESGECIGHMMGLSAMSSRSLSKGVVYRLSKGIVCGSRGTGSIEGDSTCAACTLPSGTDRVGGFVFGFCTHIDEAISFCLQYSACLSKALRSSEVPRGLP